MHPKNISEDSIFISILFFYYYLHYHYTTYAVSTSTIGALYFLHWEFVFFLLIYFEKAA